MAKSVRVDITARDKGSNVVKGFADKSGGALKKLDTHIGNVTKSMLKWTAVITGAATAAAALTKKVFDFADNIAKLSDSIGISTAALQKYQFAAKIAGVENAQLEMSMRYLIKGVSDSRVGVGTLTTALKDNQGLIKQLQNADSASDQLSIALKAINDSTDSAGLAMNLFGSRAGLAMVNLARSYKESIALAEKYGLVIDEKLLRGAEEANDAMTLLWGTIRTKLYSIILQLAPKIKEVVDRITDWIDKNKELISQKMEETFDKIGIAAKFVADNIGLIKVALIGLMGLKIVSTLATISINIAAMGTAVSKFGTEIGVAAKATGTFSGIIGSLIIDTGALTAAIYAAPTALVVWAAKLYGFKNTWIEVTSGIKAAWYEAVKSVKVAWYEVELAFVKVIHNIKNHWAQFINWLRQKLPKKVADYLGMSDAVHYPIDTASEGIESKIKDVGNYYDNLISKISDDAQKQIDVLKQFSTKAVNEVEKVAKVVEKIQKKQQNVTIGAGPSDFRTYPHNIINPTYPSGHNLGSGGINNIYALSQFGSMMAAKDRASNEDLAEASRIGAVYATYAKKFMDAQKAAAEKFKKIWGGVTRNFVSNFQDAFVSVANGTKKISTAFKELAISVIMDIERMIAKMLIMQALGIDSGGGSSGSGIFGAILSGIGSLFGGGGSEGFSTGFAKGGIIPGGFKAFAGGGIANKPTLGMIGEGGMNEAVVPLPDGKSIPIKGGMGNNITNNINITVDSKHGSDPEKSKRLAKDISDSVDQKIKETLATELRPGGMLNRQHYARAY